MRKITVAEFISLDGVVEAPDTWHMGYVDEEMMAIVFPAETDMDTMLLGRTTYDSFAGAFANLPDDDPVAANMKRPAKVAGSTTLVRTLLAAGLVDELSLLLHPVAVGSGERLFPADGPGATFTLATAIPLRSGVVHLVYRAA